MLHFRNILKLGILQVGLFWCLNLLFVNQAQAQACDSITPSFNVNLSGKPDSVWTSTAVVREGHCCGATGSDKCISFWLTLDSNSNGIRLDIPSGALPGGALFYQIGCGTSYQVGQDICLTGPGPHHITFCKPGNNLNTYQIRAIPKPDLVGRLVINEACIGNLKVLGLDPTSITWQSVPNNTTYNGYLSCLTGCDSVSVTPSGAYPPTVTYRVCGTVSGGCGAAATFCDTATVRFVSNTDVDIQPKNPTVCFGGTNATITANPVGGLAPFKYLWSNGDTNQTIQVGVGTYHVQMLDSLGCTLVRDTVTVTSFASTIDANAGNDTTICRNAASVFLRGITQGGVGGKWKGGLGTYAPNDTTLNAVYVPHSSEIFTGLINLRLVTTRNGTCPADSDAVSITIKNPSATSINGPSNVCEFKTSIFSTHKTAGSIYLWFISGGIIQSAIADTMIQVLWGSAGNGTITLRQINSFGCDSTVEKTITINPTPTPIINGPINTCKNKVSVYTTQPLANGTFVWTVIGGTIQSTVADTMINVLWGNGTTGSVTLKVTNAFLCDSTVVKNITINPTPIPIVNGPINTCKNKVSVYTTSPLAGGTFVWTVTGGTIQSTVADTMINVLWGNGTTGSVTLKVTNAFLCDSTVVKNIIINPTPTPIINGPINACKNKVSIYTTQPLAGGTFVWTVTGGTIQSTVADTMINVLWGNGTTGSVTLKVTNAFLCDSTVVKNIIINPTPIPIINGPINTCNNKVSIYTNQPLAGGTFVWTVTGGTIQSAVADTMINVLWGNGTTGSVTLKVTNAFLCDSTVVKNITINPTPTPIINGPASTCKNKVSVYTTQTLVGGTFVWTVTGGTIQSTVADTLINVLWGNGTTGSVTLKVTNAFLCDSTVVKNITINPTPTPIINGPINTCKNKVSVYTTQTLAGGTFVWTVTGGTIQSTVADTMINVLWGNGTTGSVTLKVTNPFLCDSTVVKNITINPTPTPIVNGPASTCKNKVSVYTTSPLAGGTFVWTVTGGTIQSTVADTMINVLWGNGTTGSVTLKVTNPFLCDSTVVKNIIINPNPDAHITGVNSVCVHTSHIYQSNALTATTHKWTVTGGNIIGSDTLSSLNVKWNTTGLGTLTYRGVNAALCDTVVNYTITVNPKPISAVTGNDSVCIHTTAWYYTPKQGTNTYQWQCSGGTILQQLDTAVFVRWHTLGAGWISVQETNSFNCDSIQIYPVRVLGKPMPGLAGKLQLCQHESGEYFVPKQNNVTVVWFASGFPIQNINDTAIRVYWNANGAYQVRAQVVDNLGCDTSSNVLVTVHPKPYQNFNGGNVFCSYKTINYNTIKRAGYTYEWTAIGGKIIGANNDTAVTVKWGDSTFASITLKSINPTGCDSSTTWIVTLLKAPTGQILGDSVICSNVNPNHYSIPAQPNYSYFWTAQLGGFSSTNISDQVDVNWQTPGFNNLRVRVYDNITGCDSNFNKVVYVDSIVKPVIDMQPKNGCVPFTTQMLASNLTNLGYTYVWLSGDGKKYTSANPTHTYFNAGVYPVQLKVTNANGCTDSSQTTVIANIQPKASLTYSSPTVKIYVEDTVTFYNHSTNANAYLWKLNNQTQDSTFSWMHLFELPGNYKIMLVAVDTLTGCIDSNYLRLDVRVHENVYVPNIFTPNNDGKNDFFSVGFENLASFEVIIANRWGQIIYTSTDPNFSWDGTFGGKPCQDDAYVYLITATGVQGKTFSLTGNVTLLR